MILYLTILLSSLSVLRAAALSRAGPFADNKIVIKVPGVLSSPKMDFYTAIEEAKRKNTDRNDDIQAIKDSLKVMERPFVKMCDGEIDDLEEEFRSIAQMGSSMIDDEFYKVLDGACLLVHEEKNEWKLRKEIFLSMNLESGSYGITGRLEGLKNSAREWLDYPLIKNCRTSLEECIGKRTPYKEFVTSVKTWLFTQQMFNGPDDKFGLRIPDEFIRPSWKSLVTRLNSPQGRFKVSPIVKELNFNYLMKTSGNDFKSSEANMKAALREHTTRLYTEIPTKDKTLKAVFLEDLALRKELLETIFENYDDEKLNVEIVKLRARIFERFAESAIRSLQLNKPLNEGLLVKMIKLWMMSEQMFGKDGWKDSKYGTLDINESTGLKLKNTEESVFISTANQSIQVEPEDETDDETDTEIDDDDDDDDEDEDDDDEIDEEMNDETDKETDNEEDDETDNEMDDEVDDESCEKK